MLTLALPAGPLSLLCLGAHADDIEIGCGGSVLRLLLQHPGSSVRWVVFSAAGERAAEARESAERFLAQAAAREVMVSGFRDGYLPAAQESLKAVFEQIKGKVVPDLVFTHYREDRHQDHRIISDLTWQTFRDHLVLEYEIPKYDGDFGQPNGFIPIPDEMRRRKVEHLLAAFPSQRAKSWFTAETFLGLMRLRGIESGAPEGYAEGFYARKAVLAG